MSAQDQSMSSTDLVFGMIQGFWVSRATCVAAEFGIPDLLKMANGDKLLLIESVIGPGGNTRFSKFMDLAMLVMTGGRERTEAEYRSLLSRAGRKLTRIVPTPTEMSLIEAQCA